MWFVALHKPYRGQVDEVLVRADLVMEVSTRRFRQKDKDYIPFPDDPPKQAGEVTGTWVLLDRLGWMPVIETPQEVAEAMLAAEVAYRARLAEAKVT
jgi:hypothetical protein